MDTVDHAIILINRDIEYDIFEADINFDEYIIAYILITYEPFIKKAAKMYHDYGRYLFDTRDFCVINVRDMTLTNNFNHQLIDVVINDDDVITVVDQYILRKILLIMRYFITFKLTKGRRVYNLQKFTKLQIERVLNDNYQFIRKAAVLMLEYYKNLKSFKLKFIKPDSVIIKYNLFLTSEFINVDVENLVLFNEQDETKVPIIVSAPTLKEFSTRAVKRLDGNDDLKHLLKSSNIY